MKPRRTVLTPEGRALHDFVAPFFRGLSGAVEAVRRRGAARLVVATDGALARGVIAPAIAALRARRPALEVHIAEMTSAEVTVAVRTGRADAGLAVLGPEAAELGADALFAVRVALAVPAGHALARRPARPPTLAAVAAVPLCVYERGSSGRAALERTFAAARLELEIAAEASSVEALLALVRAGVGPALVPVVGPARRSRGPRPSWREPGIVFFEAPAPAGEEAIRYGLLTRADGPRHPAVSELRRLLGARGPVGSPPRRRA